MKRIIGMTMFLLTTIVVAAQQPAQPKSPTTKEITVKSSPEQDEITRLAADLADKRKKINDSAQQAQSILDEQNKPLQAKIAPIQKQIEENTQAARTKLQTALQPLNNQAAQDQIGIQTLVPFVRKEQGLPDNATWDFEKSKWVVPVSEPQAAKK